MNISKNTIENIKKNVPIKEIIGKYANIKSNKCKCIFHDDTDASLHIYPDTNTWYCYGCRSGSDVIEFIKLAEGIEFIDAIERLANGNNINIDYNSDYIQSASDFMKVVEELKELEHDEVFGEHLLEKYDNTHKYLLDLGFKKDTLKHFEVGYCANQNDDLFNRITIPWRNSSGELVGIFGRDVTDKKDNKYKAKYGSRKGKHLYNLYNAKQYNSIILTEGEKSVWKLYEFGYPNAVALGNCDLGKRKWLLRSFTDTIILCLDNDERGIEARNDIIHDAYNLFDIHAVKLPNGYKDAAEIRDKKVFDECYENKIEVIK
jgi:DNA primase